MTNGNTKFNVISASARHMAQVPAIFYSVFLLHVWAAAPAVAQCVPNNPLAGGTVICSGIDPNGFSDNDPNLTIAVQPGAEVNNFGAPANNAPGNSHTITNSGSISTMGDFAEGILVNDANTITSNGSISTTGIDADAINADDNNTITNTGSISTTGIISDAIDVDNGNTVTNSGTILTSDLGAFGIFADDNNTITNSGSIQTTGNTGNAIDADDGNTITNSGTISTTNSFSRGIEANDNNAVLNTGSIQTNGDNADAIDGNDGNTITNTGTIITTGDLSDGLNANDNNTIVNTGSVTVSGADSDAVDVDNNTTVINSGLLRSINDNALEFDGVSNELILLPGSIMIGGLEVDFPQNTLTVSPGLSLIYTFNGFAPGTINTFGAPFTVNGLQVALADTTALGQSDEMLADLTSGIFNAVHARLTGGNGGPGGSSAFGLGGTSLMGLGARMNLLSDGAPPPSANDRRSGAWARVFGGQRDEDRTATSAQATHTYVGGIAGLDGWLSRAIQIGGFAGGAHSEIKVPLSQDIDVETFFGGAYANVTDGTNFLRVLLTAGTSDHDSTRRVLNNLVATGIQFATTSFDGDFISPEVALGTTWSLGWLTIEPSARLRYAHLSLDGFSETGSAGNLTIGDRDVSLWLGRAQVAFPFTSPAGTFAPRVGIEAWGSDDDTVSGTLLGQAVSFTPGGNDDDVTGFVGATASTTLGGGAHAFVDAEIHAGDDGYVRAEAHGGIRVSF